MENFSNQEARDDNVWVRSLETCPFMTGELLECPGGATLKGGPSAINLVTFFPFRMGYQKRARSVTLDDIPSFLCRSCLLLGIPISYQCRNADAQSSWPCCRVTGGGF